MKHRPFSSLLLFIGMFLLLPLTSEANARGCVDLLNVFLARISPAGSAWEFKPSVSQPVHRIPPAELKLLHPTYLGESVEGQALPFSVQTPEQFAEIDEKLHRRGFWILFNPSEAQDRVKTGHVSILVNRTFFTRNVDEFGPGAMISQKDFSITTSPSSARFVESRYLGAQFFEVGTAEVDKLEKFFHDRVWNFHAQNSDYRSKYVPLPFTRDQTVSRGENCVTFAYSFLQPAWQALRPELSTAAKQIGNFSVDELPSRQIYLNAASPAHRGTLLIGRSAAAYERIFALPALSDELDLFQLRLKGSVLKISGEESDQLPATFPK